MQFLPLSIELIGYIGANSGGDNTQQRLLPDDLLTECHSQIPRRQIDFLAQTQQFDLLVVGHVYFNGCLTFVVHVYKFLSIKWEKRNTVQVEALHGVMSVTNRPIPLAKRELNGYNIPCGADSSVV